MLEIKHTPAFDLAYRFVTETNMNIFLTGKAGTGKTTFLKYLRQHCYKKMVVAAPTGVAAINAGGVTLHSLFQLPFGPFVPASPPAPLQKRGEEEAANSYRDEISFNDQSLNPPFLGRGVGGEAETSRSLLSKIRLDKEKLSLFRNLELLVIDEASMVACYTVDAIDTILKSVRRRHWQPFGGVQVLFIGDIHQLQPVVKDNEWTFLRNFYPSIFFFDSTVLREHVPTMVELTEIFRQKDISFIDVLNEIRNNNLTRENFDLLNTRLHMGFVSNDDDGYITLTTHNNQADRINKEKLRRLDAPSKTFAASVYGEFAEHLYPAESKLELKIGAQVMFLKNDTEEKKYFNGKIGVITNLTDDKIIVKCKDDLDEIEVKKHEWKNVNYKLNNDTHEVTEEELGSFTQYPLRLAWAITIHKSQGLTFDKVVIDAANAFANGQVYVALSRCTTLEGLILTSPINREFLGAHQSLTEWREKNYDEDKLPKQFEQSRQTFARQELQDVFSWQNWSHELSELNKLISDKDISVELPIDSFSWMKELMNKQKELEGVAIKFSEEIVRLCTTNPVVEYNQLLQERIKKASNYFSTQITQWQKTFHNHPLSTDVKRTSKKIDAALHEINITVKEILHKINYCNNGFTLDDYLKQGKKLPEGEFKIQSSYAQNRIIKISETESSHHILYERLAEMRKRIADETGDPLFLIFNNSAIKNVCESLPGNTAALLNVSGFGKVKVKQYGDEVVDLVLEYCEENGLSPAVDLKKKKSDNRSTDTKEKKSLTVDETVALFKQRKSIEEIARERSLAVSTIEGHLALAIKKNEVKIDELMPPYEAQKIAQYFPSPLTEPIYLGAIKERAPEISFGKLRIVLAWLQTEDELKIKN